MCGRVCYIAVRVLSRQGCLPVLVTAVSAHHFFFYRSCSSFTLLTHHLSPHHIVATFLYNGGKWRAVTGRLGPIELRMASTQL